MHPDPVRGEATRTMSLLVLASEPSTKSGERKLAPSLVYVIDSGQIRFFT